MLDNDLINEDHVNLTKIIKEQLLTRTKFFVFLFISSTRIHLKTRRVRARVIELSIIRNL